jgi:aminotransferase EvaB
MRAGLKKRSEDMKVAYSYLLQQFNLDSKDIKVKYIDLPRQAHAEDMLGDIRELLLRTGQYTLGPQVAELEEKFAALCGVKYAVGVNSGTDALFLSLKVLGIGPGDEVITPPNSFLATTGAIVMVGATPVYVDVKDDYNIDPELIEAAITPRTRAIMPVHLTGKPADMPRILEIARRYGLYVIEDTAQAIGAAIDGRPTGSFGDLAGFSLHPLKNLNVWGDGGMITTGSLEYRDKLMLLRNHGIVNRDECVMFAYNSRLDTLQAIVALRLMQDLEDITSTRIKHARFYDAGLAGLADYVHVPAREPNIRQVYHTYVIQVQKRNELYKYLLENGIEAKVHYPIPLHLQEAARFLGYQEGDFPVAEAQARSILTLPVHQHLTESQLDYVIDTISKFYKG